jgi:hypothetical protein
MIELSDLIKGKMVYFKYYRQGNLMYQTECGFEFPVPIVDTNDATFPDEEKAILFMRWIRKQVNLVNSNQSGAV